jgi:hypothetical protein
MITQGSAHVMVFTCEVSAGTGLIFMELPIPLFPSMRFCSAKRRLPSVESV